MRQKQSSQRRGCGDLPIAALQVSPAYTMWTNSRPQPPEYSGQNASQRELRFSASCRKLFIFVGEGPETAGPEARQLPRRRNCRRAFSFRKRSELLGVRASRFGTGERGAVLAPPLPSLSASEFRQPRGNLERNIFVGSRAAYGRLCLLLAQENHVLHDKLRSFLLNSIRIGPLIDIEFRFDMDRIALF